MMDKNGELARTLNAGAEAWSNGDLDGFMRLYENSPETIYIRGGKVTRGYQMIRDAYASRFNDAVSMGHLTMTVRNCRALGPEYALVIGCYALRDSPLSAGIDNGIFTLVLRRFAQAWRIISDQTS